MRAILIKKHTSRNCLLAIQGGLSLFFPEGIRPFLNPYLQYAWLENGWHRVITVTPNCIQAEIAQQEDERRRFSETKLTHRRVKTEKHYL